MIRATSSAAHLKALRKLPARQLQIVEHLKRSDRGHHTRARISQETGIPLQSVCSVVNALVKKGRLIETPKRKCPVTGNDAVGLWWTT